MCKNYYTTAVLTLTAILRDANFAASQSLFGVFFNRGVSVF
jgi:hypothetical protein